MEIVQYQNQNAVLYLSGLFGGGWAWDEVIKHVESTKDVVINDPLCSIGNSAETITEALLPVLSSMSESVTIVGNSMGGVIAMKLALRMPEKVDQVIISGSAGFNEVDLGYPLAAGLLRNKIDEYSLKLAHTIYHDHDKIRVVDLERLRETLAGYKKDVLRLMSNANKDVTAHELLEKIKVPVHAIWGRQDVVTPLSKAELVLRRYGVDVDVIDNCGHSPMCESPVEFAHCLNKHLTFNQPVVFKLLA